jgi:hypothetical protein
MTSYRCLHVEVPGCLHAINNWKHRHRPRSVLIDTMAAERKPPIILQPISPPSDPSKAAAFIFVHGLGDEAEGVESA